jgi:hypothetical protein
MAATWDPRSKYPDNAASFAKWFVSDVELFRKSRPDLPQGVLGARARNKVVRAWNKAREAAEREDAAKISPEYYQAMKTFHRTRTITLPLKKKATKPRKSRRDQPR